MEKKSVAVVVAGCGKEKRMIDKDFTLIYIYLISFMIYRLILTLPYHDT